MFANTGLEQIDQPLGKATKSSLKEVILKYLHSWPLFLVLLILSIAATWFYLKMKVPVYETTATILIKDEKKGTDDAKGIEALNLFGSKKIVENEIEVLKSNNLAQKVVMNLHLYADVLEEGKFTDHSAYITSPVQIVAQNPDSIKHTVKQPFAYNANTKQVIISEKAYPLNSWIKSPYSTLKFILNENYSPPAEHKQLFFSLVPVKIVANGIVDNLNVNATNKLSTVIDISFRDEIPQRGEDIVNELVGEYKKVTIADKNILAANTLAFVEDRLGFVEHTLDSVEKRLQQFKTKNRIVDIGIQGRLYLENVSANDQKINDISMQVAILSKVENYVLSKGGQGGIVPSTIGVNDPVLPILLDKLYNAELEYEKVRKIAPENNPMLVSLSAQINKIKPNILENILNQKENLLAGKKDLTTTNSKYIAQLQTIPERERELLEISRQQTIKNNIYTFLLQKREEAALAYASTVGDSRQIDQAQSSEAPVSPKKPLIYFISVIGAFSLGAGIVFIKESWNNKIVTRAEIKQFTDVPIVGELIYTPTNKLIVVDNNIQSLLAEQFRHLRTSLHYLCFKSGAKKILITSSISREGKSFIAANIATSLALTKKKVVLLELDLRKPNLFVHPKGITDFLLGNKKPQEIIESTELVNDLFIIPAGPIPPNPSELLVNGKIEELLAYLEDKFDYVVIDSSPVIPVTDAYLLSPLCDVTLLVIRQGVTPISVVQTLVERFQTKGLKNVAIVFNGLKEKEFGKYYYGYSRDCKYVNSQPTV